MYRKFIVTRTDGSSARGKKHFDCEYFVLDMTHDPAAIPAIAAYELAIRQTHPKLARDLRVRYLEPKETP